MLLHTGLHFHSWRSKESFLETSINMMLLFSNSVRTHLHYFPIFIINNNPVILLSPEQSNTLDRFFLVLIHCWILFGVEGCLECHYYETTCHWLESVLYSFSHYLSNVCVVWMLNNISIVARIQSESSFSESVSFLSIAARTDWKTSFPQTAALQKSHLFCVHAMYDVKGDLFCNSLWNGLPYFDILWWIIFIIW